MTTHSRAGRHRVSHSTMGVNIQQVGAYKQAHIHLSPPCTACSHQQCNTTCRSGSTDVRRRTPALVDAVTLPDSSSRVIRRNRQQAGVHRSIRQAAPSVVAQIKLAQAHSAAAQAGHGAVIHVTIRKQAAASSAAPRRRPGARQQQAPAAAAESGTRSNKAAAQAPAQAPPSPHAVLPRPRPRYWH